MSGEQFSGGTLQHSPNRYLPDDLMGNVEKDVQYACTDVALRDPDTGKLFLGNRQTEPQIGPWFIGGRNPYELGASQSGAFHVKRDLGLEITPSRFKTVAVYTTTFPAASPNRQEHGRSTQNAVTVVDLQPQELEKLNKNLSNGDVRDEYSGGQWVDPAEISKSDSDYPDLLKQFVRDLNRYDASYAADWDAAIAEDKHRTIFGSPEDREKEILIQANRLEKQFGFTSDEAYEIAKQAGPNADYSILWAKAVEEDSTEKKVEITEFISDILDADKYVGDYNVKKLFKENGLTAPEVFSDNGPAMRAVLRGARLAIEANDRHDGKIFKDLKRIQFLGRAGAGPLEQ